MQAWLTLLDCDWSYRSLAGRRKFHEACAEALHARAAAARRSIAGRPLPGRQEHHRLANHDGKVPHAWFAAARTGALRGGRLSSN